MRTLDPIIHISILLLTVNGLNAQSFLSIDVKANRLLYDSKRDKIYATVRSTDLNYGNSLVQINPYTGAIENNVFIGSEPMCMDITKDTNFLYIGLDGASFVKRINLNFFQIDKSISLGNGPDGPFYAADVAAVNLSANLVVVSRKYTTVSPDHAGVAAYLNGYKLPRETPDHTGSNVIESATDTNLVFGYNNASTENGFRRMQIDTTTGVNLIDVTDDMFLGEDFEFKEGLLYSDRGYVLDPFLSIPTFLGTYANISWDNAVEPDYVNNKIFFADAASGLEIVQYNLQNFTLGDVTDLQAAVPNSFVLPEAVDMVRYGSRGLAIIVYDRYFSDETRVILHESCLVQGGSDLTIGVNLSSNSINPNDTVELKIIVSNAGSIDASSVTIIDTFNNSIGIISGTANTGNIQITGNILQWDVNAIQPSHKDTASIQIYFSQSGNVFNKIYGISSGFECNAADNTVSSLIAINCPRPVSNFNFSDSSLTVFFVNYSTHATDWLWEFDDNTTDTAQNPIHTFPTSGNYFVCLTASSNCGSDNDCDNVTVIASGIGKNQTRYNLTTYPNPVNDYLYFAYENTSAEKTSIIDMNGKIILEETSNGLGMNGKKINFSDYTPGVYLLRIQTKDDMIQTKIIKL